jgi:predicted DNA binding CopG/RHH family protein
MNYEAHTVDFERDWTESEAHPFITETGAVLRALEELRIPKPEIDALEHRAAVQKIPLQQAIQNVLQKGLSCT